MVLGVSNILANGLFLHGNTSKAKTWDERGRKHALREHRPTKRIFFAEINLEVGRERPLVIILKNDVSDRFKDLGITIQCRRYIAVVTKKLDRAVKQFFELFSGHEMIQGSGFVRGR